MGEKVFQTMALEALINEKEAKTTLQAVRTTIWTIYHRQA
jgi:hypothetical protein